MLITYLRPIFILLTLYFYGFGQLVVFAQTQQKTRLQLVQSQYLSQDNSSNSTSAPSTDFVGSYELDLNRGSQKARINLSLFQSAHVDHESYLDVKEVYWAHQATYYQFTVGRKLENWSQLDNFWHLGVWQPHLRHQGFSFSAQGLTGVFGQWSGQQWKALVFASPLFLPDQGPKVEVREGQLFVRNRWFSHPVDRVRIGELSSPLAFKLIEPEISEVVFQNQVAGQFIFADGLYGNWGSMAYAYKPINQFYIGLRPIHHVSSSNVNKITEIEVYPQIRYHHLATVEVGRRWHQGEVWASVIRDEPVNKDVPVLWVSQEFPPVWLFGIGASTNIKLPFFRNLHFSGSYLQRQSDDQKPNEFLNSNLEVLSDRFIFTEALAVEMEWFRPIRSNLKISMNTRFIHSLAYSGETLSLELGVHSSRGWLAQVGAEFIGSNNPNGSDFFNQYRANDRIYGGVGYVF